MGIKLKEQNIVDSKKDYVTIKEAVFPFSKFPGVDPILGPEMKSTGEVMGIGKNFGEAFAKSQMAANIDIPISGKAFLSVKDDDKEPIVSIAKNLIEKILKYLPQMALLIF